MAGEKPTPNEGIPQEANRDNVAYLEGYIPLLSRRLLYGNLDQTAEIEGYRELRGYFSHADPHIHNLVSKAVDARWDKVEFYQKKLPRPSPGLWDVPRIVFVKGENIFDREIEVPHRVALLMLGRRFGELNGAFISNGDFANQIRPLLGPEVDPDDLASVLKKQYVLTEEGEYVALIEAQKGKLRIGRKAYDALAGHLPVLETISYPDISIDQDQIRFINAVDASVETAYKSGMKMFEREENMSLQLQVESRYVVDLHSIEMDLELEKKIPATQGVIAFLTEEGEVYRFTHHDPKPYYSHLTPENIQITLYEQPQGARRELLINHDGRQILGIKKGTIVLENDKRRVKEMKVEGVFMPDLPPGLEEAQEMQVSVNKIIFFLENISNQTERMPATIVYARPFGDDDPTTDFRQRKTHVSNTPYAVRIWEKSRYDTVSALEREIRFDQPHAEIVVKHPRGGTYTVAYEMTEAGIAVTFVGEGWRKELVLPGTIEPDELAQKVESHVTSLVDHVEQHRQSIAEQVQAARRLTIAEDYVLSHIDEENAPPDSDLLDFIIRKAAEAPKGVLPYMQAIDEGLAKLDSKNQWVVRAYMKCLGGWRFQTKEFPEKDPRPGIRFLIRKYNLPIPSELLEACEAFFSPEDDDAPAPLRP